MIPDAQGGHGQVFADLAALGGFFVLAAPPAPGTDAVPWTQALSDQALLARFATVRRALAGSLGLPIEQVDPKVAVSATQVGLASRLWSVALAGAVLHGWLPDLSSENLMASPGHGGPVPLGVRDPDAGYAVPAVTDDPAAAASVLAGAVVPSLTLLADACARAGRAPRRVLTSNASSSLIGGVRVLAGLRPQHGHASWRLARALLDLPEVADGGARVAAGSLPDGVGGAMEHVDEAFLRSGCCVFYRLPGHGLCPDCVLAPSRAGQVTPGR